jgi:hypothetical protein
VTELDWDVVVGAEQSAGLGRIFRIARPAALGENVHPDLSPAAAGS